MSMPLPYRKLVVFKSGILWEMLPLEPDCGSGVTCWRRLRDLQEAGACDQLHRRLMDRLGAHDVIVWICASLHNGALDPHAPAAGASDGCSGTIILRAKGEIIGGVGFWLGALAVHILWPVDYHRPSHFLWRTMPDPRHMRTACYGLRSTVQIRRPFDTQGSLDRNSIRGATRLWQSGRPDPWI